MVKFIVHDRITQIKEYIEKEIEHNKEIKYRHCWLDNICGELFVILFLMFTIALGSLFLFSNIFCFNLIIIVTCIFVLGFGSILAYRDYSSLKAKIKELTEVLSFSEAQLLEYINSHKEDIHETLNLCMYLEEHPEKILKISWITKSCINVKYEHNSIVKDIDFYITKKETRTDISDSVFEWSPEGLKCKLKYEE